MPSDELRAVVGSQSASAVLDVSLAGDGHPWPTAPQVGVVGSGLSYSDLTPSGSITTKSHGQVIEGLDIDGRVKIVHDDVTLRQCRIRYGGNYGIYIEDGGNGTPWNFLVEDVEVDYSSASESPGNTPITIYQESGLGVFRRLHVHSAFRGLVAIDDTTVEDSLIEVDRQDVNNPDAHRTALSFRRSGLRVFRSHLHITTPAGASSALSIYPDLGAPADCLVQDSLLDCQDASGQPHAGYATYGGNDAATNIRYFDNHITHGRSGHVAQFYSENEGNEFTGNRDWPSESPI